MKTLIVTEDNDIEVIVELLNDSVNHIYTFSTERKATDFIIDALRDRFPEICSTGDDDYALFEYASKLAGADSSSFATTYEWMSSKIDHPTLEYGQPISK